MERFSEETIEEVLRREDDGVLTFADDNEPYGVPVSYGYDGDRFVFQLSKSKRGRKADFIDEEPLACFIVYAKHPNRVVESVIATGKLRSVPESDQREAFAVLRENTDFPLDRELWSGSDGGSENRLYELVPETLSGRAYGTGKP
ncbi:pyridoxamine 5'-phosphate oxidase [Halalkaliarchaeum desulfuricum]|uniref:Pyridoxamine 5'-phosphate oxidase n=1 Tax=Halalkaliarchaeum desulfuricum TaxID=2055893 RepID=A0A343TMS1_9EURY|nr:pyridoxamine 5'-phosphate oxidase family protein [Halalkaliarchaeum desulfuricum]AUX10393.1 pyridoxamine 5'-phosphate oxidase [Halalkaliarchaeum desulfuricum]